MSAATLGTRRAPVDDASLWPHDDLAPAGEGADAERKLLRAAAAQRLYELAGGRTAAQPVETSEPLQIDRARFVSEAAVLRLMRMLRGEHRALIEEWSSLVRQARRQLPPQFAPLALTHLKPTDAEGFGDMLGPTGAWLAKLNTQWAFAFSVAAPSHERWQSGSSEERRAELSAMRRVDPAQARAWLQETWATDPPEQRDAFLQTFEVGLSLQDEPFLETVLDDKRKAVRQTAVQLLARLPESGLVQRHCARLDALVSIEEKKGLLAKLARPTLRLTIESPQAIDKAMQRDGVDPKPPAQQKIGERTFWLAQMFALAPPQHWTERFSCDAATFVDAALESDYGRELLPALTEAAARHPDRAWLEALTDAWLASKEHQGQAPRAIAEMTQNAPEPLRQALLVVLLGRLDPLRDQQTIHSLLAAAPFAFGAELTQLAIGYVRALALRQSASYQQNRNAFDHIGYRCDVPTAGEMLAPLLAAAPPDSSWRNAVEQLNDIVEFRAAMRREIS